MHRIAAFSRQLAPSKTRLLSQQVSGSANFVFVVPDLGHGLVAELRQVMGPTARIYPQNHDFRNDSAFPDPNVRGLGIAVGNPDLIDLLITKLTPQVSWIHCFFAGVDAVVTETLRSRPDISLTNAKGAFNVSLAEFCLFGFLYFAKLLPTALERYKKAEWRRWEVSMLRGRTLAIVGYGSIGEEIAKMATNGFGMKVLAVKRDPAKTSARARAHVHAIFPTTEVKQVLARSDYVVGVLPGTRATHHFFDAAMFAAMKPGAVFMNIGRGVTCSEAALLKALDSNHLRGAVLDVQEIEPLPADSPLWKVGHEKLLLTPHCADLTSDFWALSSEVFAKNLADWQEGRPFTETVDKGQGY